MGYEPVPAPAGGGGGGSGEGGVTDHGALTGLGDNDHPQYRLASAGSLTPGTATGTDRQLVITGTGATVDDSVANVRTVTFTGGAPGANGRSVLTGSNPPDDLNGVNGEYWLQRNSTRDLWGPKVAGTWATNGFVSLVGPTGATGNTGNTGSAGADGKTVLSGTAAPTTEGVNGDFYIRNPTTTPVLYGPKTAGAWGSGISMVGPMGPSGGGSLFSVTKVLASAGPIVFTSSDGVDGDTHKSYRLVVHGKNQNGWGYIRIKFNDADVAYDAGASGTLLSNFTEGCGAFIDINAQTGFRRGGCSHAWHTTNGTAVGKDDTYFLWNNSVDNLTKISLHFWDSGDTLTEGFAAGTRAVLTAI